MNKKHKNCFIEDLEYEEYEYKNYILNKKEKIERQKERKDNRNKKYNNWEVMILLMICISGIIQIRILLIIIAEAPRF